MNTKWIVICATGALVFVYLAIRFESKPGSSAPRSQNDAQITSQSPAENDQLQLKLVDRMQTEIAIEAVTNTVTPPSAPPEMNDPPQDSIATEISKNLRRISDARAQFILEKNRLPSSLAELLEANYIKRISAINGEDYSQLSLQSERFSVTSASGVVVNFESGPLRNPAAPDFGRYLAYYKTVEKDSAPVGRAILAYRSAQAGFKMPESPNDLLPFFSTPMEAAEFSAIVQAVEQSKIAQ